MYAPPGIAAAPSPTEVCVDAERLGAPGPQWSQGAPAGPGGSPASSAYASATSGTYLTDAELRQRMDQAQAEAALAQAEMIKTAASRQGQQHLTGKGAGKPPPQKGGGKGKSDDRFSGTTGRERKDLRVSRR